MLGFKIMPVVFARRRALFALGAGLCGWGLAGCGDVATSFPMGLEPLEENTAPRPAPVGTDATPETLSVVFGTRVDEMGRTILWAHARGYIRAPLARVWTAMRTGAANVDRRNTTEFMVIPEQDPAYTDVFLLKNIVRAAATVTFDIRWRHGVVAGTVTEPRVVAARWAKVFGTTFIELMRGSATAERVSDQVTEVSMVYQVAAFSRTAEDSAQFLRDLYGSWLAVVQGRPLPTYR